MLLAFCCCVTVSSVFGLFNVPPKWYSFFLLVVFQLLMQNVSLLGHLCGILSGFAYTYGLFNFLIPRTSFYSSTKASSLLDRDSCYFNLDSWIEEKLFEVKVVGRGQQ
ncbi:rhomboid-like protein 15 [Lotus japonicus]|uniref:rhomboid-like protein 15 n=1 Tax=Lotus japonicus TaxID=34305 RepID=UPI002589350A|nr:rhomboid-like protein 15 [Lotus japonicus]XP_057445425.1 rhomboid-like protein 15 [Lotus japonicus]